MIRIFCIFFILLLNSHTFAQSGSPSRELLLIKNYNSFLTGAGLSGVIHARNFSSENPGYFSEVPGLAVRKLKVLTLESEKKYYSVVDFAKALNKLNGGDTTGVLLKKLFLKFYDYLPDDKNDVALVLSYRQSKSLRAIIYYDKEIKILSGLPVIKGDVGINGPGNPEESAYGGIITGVSAQPSLIQKLKSGLKAYISGLSSTKSFEPGFAETDNEHTIRLEVRNMKGLVTPGFHEKLFLTMFLLPARQGRVDIHFLFTITYAPGVFGIPKEENFRDASPYYLMQVSNFGQRLKEKIRSSSR